MCDTTTHSLQHTATHGNTLQHTATHCNTRQVTATHCKTLQLTATHCNTLQHTAEFTIVCIYSYQILASSTFLSCTWHASLSNRDATHYNTLQHTATHCNTLSCQSRTFQSVCEGARKRDRIQDIRVYISVSLSCFFKLSFLLCDSA